MLKIMNTGANTVRNFILAGTMLAAAAICGGSTAQAQNDKKTTEVTAYTEGMGGISNSGYKLMPIGTIGLGVQTLSKNGFFSDAKIGAGTVLNGELIAGYQQQTSNDRVKMNYYGTVAGYYNLINNETYPANTDMIVTSMTGKPVEYHLNTEQTLHDKGFNAGAGVKIISQLDRKGIVNLGFGLEAGYHTSAYNVHYHTKWSELTQTYTKEVYNYSKYQHPWYLTPKLDLLVNMPKGFYAKLDADFHRIKAGFGWKFWESNFKKVAK